MGHAFRRNDGRFGTTAGILITGVKVRSFRVYAAIDRRSNIDFFGRYRGPQITYNFYDRFRRRHIIILVWKFARNGGFQGIVNAHIGIRLNGAGISSATGRLFGGNIFINRMAVCLARTGLDFTNGLQRANNVGSTTAGAPANNIGSFVLALFITCLRLTNRFYLLTCRLIEVVVLVFTGCAFLRDGKGCFCLVRSTCSSGRRVIRVL